MEVVSSTIKERDRAQLYYLRFREWPRKGELVQVMTNVRVVFCLCKCTFGKNARHLGSVLVKGLTNHMY